MPDATLTPAQRKVLDSIQDRLAEHFDGFVLVVRVAGDEPASESRVASFGGGFSQAVGMLSLAHSDMLAGKITNNDEDDEHAGP